MKRENGITLVSLVITIVILIILSSIIISSLVGENGILNKAKAANDKYNLASMKEEVSIILTEYQFDTLKHSEMSLEDLFIQKGYEYSEIDNIAKVKKNNVEVEFDINTFTILEQNSTNNDVKVAKSPITQNSNKKASFNKKTSQQVLNDEKYIHNGEYVFTGNNYINTNIYLYNEKNIHRNFIISFDIVQVDESNVNHNALMNSMNESGNPWSGHVIKVSVNGAKKSLKFESNSNTSSSGDVYIPSAVKNVRVIRINDILYYSFDGRQCIKINDYNGFKDTFDVPVTFGASINGNMAPFRYFKGTLSNMSVSFIDDGARIEDFNNNNEKKDLKVKYEHKGKFVFNGENFYINTGLYLFNYEGFYKDFEISFNIDSVEPGNVQQATLVNAKNETINSFPAFVYRLYQSTDGTIKFESKGGTGSGASNKIKDVKKVKISRINSKMYLSVNDEENKQVYDFTGFTNYFSIPLTIGASLDSKGKPFRFFKGTLSDIVIKVEE